MNLKNPEEIKTIDALTEEFKKVFLLADEGLIKITVATVIANRLPLDPVWLLLVAGPSGGKCLGKDTPVMMSDGTIKKVQDIKKGEYVMGDDSRPRKVLDTTSGTDDLYEVQQKRGENYIVNSSHILTLKNNQYKTIQGIHSGETVDISLDEYLKRSQNFKRRMAGFKVAIDLPKREVSLDPYFLGVWLGDGRCNSIPICNPEPEIQKYLAKYAKELGMRLSVYDDNGKKCPSFAIVNKKPKRTLKNFISAGLEKENLLNNKHIPVNYLLNDKETRLQLLAGIIDTDGYLSPEKNSFEVLTKYQNLGEQIVFLARSLGLYAKMTKKKSGIKSSGFSGWYWRIYINGDIHIIPNKVKRKKSSQKKMRTDSLSTSIKVTPIGRGEYYGFQIEGNGRFLLGDFTVTHNSEVISSLDGLDFVYSISDLTVNTFASGQRSTGKETSLLLKIGSGMMAFKDFTSVLSKNKDARKEILGQLREIYDGKYVKRTGTGEDITWSGKIGAIAGVTEVVYRFLEDLSAMGDRFILYSIEAPDRIEASNRTLEISGRKQELREHLKNCVTNYIEYAVMNLEDVEDIEISRETRDEILSVADFAARARSAVLTDFKTGAVDFVPSIEAPMRLVQQLYSLASAFVAMKRVHNLTGMKGGEPKHDITDDEKRLLVKIAFDSIPRTRRDVLFLLASYKVGARTAGIATQLNLPSDSVKKYLYQVNALGICTRKSFSGNGGDRWTMNDHYRDIMKMLLRDKLIIKDQELLGRSEEEEHLEDEWDNIPFDDNGNIPNEYVL